MIVIDPGHGGSDIGGGSNQYWLEKDLALKISLYEYNRLKELGIPVALTREGDETLTPELRVRRAKKAFGTENTILISNHINSSPSGFSGAEFVYSINDNPDLVNTLATEFKEAGQTINRIYQRQNSEGKDFYYIIRNTRPMKSIIIEYGFANSNDDINFLRDDWMTLAEATVKGIANYLNVPYTPPQKTYQVQLNDSLYKIAEKFNISVEMLKKVNNIKNDIIYPNQTLIIPDVRAHGTYITLPNESLFIIAIKNNISIDKIIQLNNINNLELRPNQIIYIDKK